MTMITDHNYNGESPCVFRGRAKRRQTRVTNRFDVFDCSIHGQCAVVDSDYLKETVIPIHSCLSCGSRLESAPSMGPTPEIPNPGYGRWVFRNYESFTRDVLSMISRLPEISAVCGVPRSGLIPASIISSQLGLPLVAIDSLVEGRTESWRPGISKPLSGREGSILVIDDTSWSGRSIRNARSSIHNSVRDRCVFAAVYAGEQAISAAAVDFAGFVMPTLRHCFSWNYLRDIFCGRTLSDMDGVLCGNWPGHRDDGSSAYSDWVKSVRPVTRPAYELLGVVTGRVKTFEAETVEWLSKNGVKYKNLHMLFDDVESRTGKDVGARKADVYEQYPLAELFVESDEIQADVIFKMTGRPVLCTDTQEMFQ